MLTQKHISFLYLDFQAALDDVSVTYQGQDFRLNNQLVDLNQDVQTTK